MRIKPNSPSDDNAAAGPGTRRSRSSDHARKRVESRHADDPSWKLQLNLLPNEVEAQKPAAEPKPKLPRLDAWLVEHGMAASREKAKAAIEAGTVWVNGKNRVKPSTPVAPTDAVEVREG